MDLQLGNRLSAVAGSILGLFGVRGNVPGGSDALDLGPSQFFSSSLC